MKFTKPSPNLNNQLIIKSHPLPEVEGRCDIRKFIIPSPSGRGWLSVNYLNFTNWVRALLLLIFFCLLHFPANAQMTNAKISKLGVNLVKLIEPYQGKVGISFIDINSGLKLSINGKKRYPAASVAKVPVMATVYHLAETGKMSLSDKIMFNESDKLGGSGVLQWMRGGKEYSIRNLSRLMIVLSDNTATRLVIDRIGTSEINSYMQTLGLLSTQVVDDTCLNEPPTTKINYTTPNEMALLFYEIQKSGNYSLASRKEMINFMKNQRFRWGIWRGVPKGIVVADKTGNVDGVLNDSGIVYTKKGNYILSIFTNGFKKQRDARNIINKISELVYAGSR